MQRRGRVLSIGPGGGLDALLSLYHGASQFDGAELNPSIVGIMRDYRKFNGGIYERPDVHVVTREGRAFVREAVAQGQRYSMIFSALTKTATAGQGMALLESFIHTEDAFSDYQKALDTNGQLTLVVDNPALLARFFTTAVSLLKAQGMSETTACQHIILMHDPRPYGPYQFALVLQKSVLSRAQTFDIFDRATERQLIPIWIPYQASRPEFGPYPDIASGRINLDQFIQWFGQLGQPLDITPCPDDRPFVLDLSPTLLPIFKQLTALVLLLSLALAGLGAFDVARRQPSLSNTSTASHDTLDEEVGSEVVNASGGTTVTPAWGLTDVLYVFYFLCLGLGFMLVEIPLSQKLILPLGYPTLALTVILFSVLLGGGLGSWFSQNVADERLSRWAAGCAIGIAIATVVSSFVLGSLGQVMLLMNLPVRCLVVALLLMPLGFLLGTPFPSGMRLFSQRRAGQVPLIWGLNGVSSVVGSLCAAMGAKSWGFNNVMVAGAVVYLGAALLLMGIDKLQNQPVLSVNNGEGEADRPLTADVNSTGTAQEPTGSVPVGS